jgi:hypothetical protein
MWSYYHNPGPEDLINLAEPKGGNRKWDVIGFVLTDPFDTFLRKLSVDYLQNAWQQLNAILRKYKVMPSDLSWAYLHPGETHVPGTFDFAPHQYLGWCSIDLWLANREGQYDDLYRKIDTKQKQVSPSVRYAITWRSVKWHIAPENFAKGLEIVEVMCTSEPSYWAPELILQSGYDIAEPWVQVAQAMLGPDQQLLDRALNEARASYTPLGYRIVLRGYATYAYGDPAIRVQIPTSELLPRELEE